MISKAVLRWVLATSLPWPLLLIYAALLAALAHAGSQAPTWMEYLQWTPGLSDWLAWNARADGWSMALLIVGTGMCARAAWLVERWKRHDIDWLRTRPVSAVRLHASVLLALLIAALAWLGIGAAVLETLPPPKLAHEARGRVAAQDAIWVDGHALERVRIADQSDGDALSLAWIATRGAPQVRLHAGWQGAEEFATAEITTRGRLLIPLPAKDSARVLELRVEPEQAAALMAPMDSYILQRSGNPRESALRMVAQAWPLIGLAVCASLLCALWMRAGIAVALVAVLMLALSTRLPAPEALHYMRQGWLPRWPGSNLMAAVVIGCTLTPLLAGWSWSRLRRQR